MTDELDIEIYSTESGNEPFTEWLDSFKDKKTKTALVMRIQRLREGNFGDFDSFDGLYELRIHLDLDIASTAQKLEKG